MPRNGSKIKNQGGIKRWSEHRQKRSNRLKSQQNHNKTIKIKEEIITKQFTFYSLYTELMDTLTDDERGGITRRMCAYMFGENQQTELADKKLRFLWGNIIDCLESDKQARLSGKTPKGLNRQMPHFTFYENFNEAIELMEDKQAGQYVKAIYGYMLDGKEPTKLPAPVDLYYRLAKRKLALSKVRGNVGKKGGTAERKPVTTEQINAIQPDIASIGIDGFLKNNPQVRNDIFNSSLHLTQGIDWTFLDDLLPQSAYHDCKSLYQILTHYKEIMGG